MVDLDTLIEKTVKYSLNFREDMLFERVMNVIDEYESRGEKPDYDSFKNWCRMHVYSDIKDWKQFKYEELRDSDDDRYPSDYWLACLRRGKFLPPDYDKLMSYLHEAWYTFGDDTFAEKINANAWKFYTGGWSGNEDIMYALLSSLAPYVFDIERVNPSTYIIKRRFFNGD